MQESSQLTFTMAISMVNFVFLAFLVGVTIYRHFIAGRVEINSKKDYRDRKNPEPVEVETPKEPELEASPKKEDPVLEKLADNEPEPEVEETPKKEEATTESLGNKLDIDDAFVKQILDKKGTITNKDALQLQEAFDIPADYWLYQQFKLNAKTAN